MPNCPYSIFYFYRQIVKKWISSDINLIFWSEMTGRPR